MGLMAAINPVIKSFPGCLPLCFYVPINEGLRIAITLQYAAFAPGLPIQIQWLCSNAQREGMSGSQNFFLTLVIITPLI